MAIGEKTYRLIRSTNVRAPALVFMTTARWRASHQRQAARLEYRKCQQPTHARLTLKHDEPYSEQQVTSWYLRAPSVTDHSDATNRTSDLFVSLQGVPCATVPGTWGLSRLS